MYGLRLEAIKWLVKDTQGFQVAVVVKNLPANAGDRRDEDSVPGSGRSPGGGHGNPLQYSCLENPMDREAWWATVHGVAKSQTRLSDFTYLLSLFRYLGKVLNSALTKTGKVLVSPLHAPVFLGFTCLSW